MLNISFFYGIYWRYNQNVVDPGEMLDSLLITYRCLSAHARPCVFRSFSTITIRFKAQMSVFRVANKTNLS